MRRRRFLHRSVAAAIGAGAALWLWQSWPDSKLAAMVTGEPANAVHVGVVYPLSDTDDLFVRGVQLAVDEINAGGGLMGRPLVTRVRAEQQPDGDFTDADAVSDALDTAGDLAADPRMLAVIGHGSSLTAVPVSALYERKNKLFLAPYATNVALTAHKFTHVFGLIPNDLRNAALLARQAADMGLKRMVILSDKTEYGRQTATMFAQYAEAQGLTMVHRDTIDTQAKSIEQTLLPLLDNDSFSFSSVDGVLVIAQPVDSGRLIRAIRHLGVQLPVLGTDALDTPECEAEAGPAMNNVYALTVFHPSALENVGSAFAEAFRARYTAEPTVWAALGYDSVKLLAEASRRAGSLDPAVLADTLRIMRYAAPYQGATGRFAFNRRGEAVAKPVYIVRHDGWRFHLVRTIDTETPSPEGTATPPAPAAGQTSLQGRTG